MDDIYLARFVEGKYERPVNLGGPINSAAEETTPFVAPDGKYLFFLSQRDGESHVYWVSAAVIEKLRLAGAKK
jgi:Tol biopolymer transport system component